METKINIRTLHESLNMFKRYGMSDDWMSRPFSIENHIYATDGIAIFRVNKKLFMDTSQYLENDKYVSIIKEKFRDDSSSITYYSSQRLESVIKKIPLVDEYLETDEQGNCDVCDGFGEVEWEFEEHTKMDDCPVCDGYGKIEIEKRTPTGHKVMDQNIRIRIKNSNFNNELIEKLLRCCKMLGIETFSLIKQTSINEPTLFRLTDDIEIVLMPVLRNGESNDKHIEL